MTLLHMSPVRAVYNAPYGLVLDVWVQSGDDRLFHGLRQYTNLAHVIWGQFSGIVFVPKTNHVVTGIVRTSSEVKMRGAHTVFHIAGFVKYLFALWYLAFENLPSYVMRVTDATAPVNLSVSVGPFTQSPKPTRWSLVKTFDKLSPCMHTAHCITCRVRQGQ